MPSQPTYRVSLEDEVFRSMKVDNGSRTPYSDATQVGTNTLYFDSIFKSIARRAKTKSISEPMFSKYFFCSGVTSVNSIANQYPYLLL